MKKVKHTNSEIHKTELPDWFNPIEDLEMFLRIETKLIELMEKTENQKHFKQIQRLLAKITKTKQMLRKYL